MYAETSITEYTNETVIAMKNYICNILRLISPVIDVAYDMQKEHGDILLKANKQRIVVFG